MRLLQRVPRRWRSLATEVTKFASVGGVNTVVNLAIFNVLLTIGPIKANVVATVVATTCSYFMNRHWTYRHLPKKRLRREYTLFFCFNLVGLVIESAILGLARYGLGFDEHSDVVAFNIAKFAGLVIGTVFRFWAYRTFVFHAAPAGAEAAPTPPSRLAAVGAGDTAVAGTAPNERRP